MDKTSKRGAFLVNLMYFVAVTAIVVLFIRYAVGWLMPFIIGLAVAMAFAPLIRFTSRKLKLNRRVAACIIIVLGYAVLVTIVSILSIQLISLCGRLFAQLPSFFETQIMPILASSGNLLSGFANELPQEWLTVIEGIQASLINAINGLITNISSGGVSFVTNFIRAFPAFLVAMIFTILASFFISMDYSKTVGFLMSQLSVRGREIVRAVREAFRDTVFSYARAYLKIMMITFSELAIGLTILGVKNSFLIAFGIAIFDILPVFGTGGIVLPWTIISFATGNTAQGVGLLVLYGIITVVRNFVEPKIVGDQLGLNPIVSIIAIYLGFVWFGVLGMILMPISVQIALSLHDKGVVTLYKRVDMIDDEVDTKKSG